MAVHYCEKCGKNKDVKEFYKSKNVEKYPPDGTLNICKSCMTMHVDNWDPESYKWILQEVDVPYIKEEWDSILEKYANDPKKLTGLTVLGRYLSKMKLKQWSKYGWADTEVIEEEKKQKKIESMRAQGMSGEEIDEQLSMDRTPKKPKLEISAVGTPEFTDYEEPDEFSDQLTEEDKAYLRLKWGKSYRAEEWVRMEQLYLDMEKSYDIQLAGHKDTLIMLCKTSLKTNQLLDAGDIEGAQKMAKVYDSLMKSGKFTAVQNKEEQGEFVDSIGELVAICERDKFIPKYYVDSPKDKVDRVIQDMQDYTHDLVTEELGLGNLIENSLRALQQEKESIEAAASSGLDFEEQQEQELFGQNFEELADQDFIDFYENAEEETNEEVDDE